MDSLKKLNSVYRLSRNRWHIAYAAICSARAFCNPLKSSEPRSYSRIPTESYIIDAVQLSSRDINQSRLRHLVDKKDLDHLGALGGVKGLMSALKTDGERGILADSDDISQRQEAFGMNTYPRPPAKSLFSFVVEQLKDTTVIIILVCAVLALVFGMIEYGAEGWYLGVSVFTSVLFVICISVAVNLKHDRLFRKLSMASNNNIQMEVLRSGMLLHISVDDIVVGDVVCLKTGDRVPADGLLIEGHSLQIDEASMTGESDHVKVDLHENPFLRSGTEVVDGHAKFLVTSVGINTAWGETMRSISHDSSEETPLQSRLNKLFSLIGNTGLAVGLVEFVILLIRYLTGNSEDEDGQTKPKGVVGIIAYSLTLIVVMIPEGLSLAVTLTRYYSTRRMFARQPVAKQISSCETMGSVTAICMDKTGTLTINKMEVTKFLLGQEFIEKFNYTLIASSVMELFHQGVGLNTTGSVYKTDSGSKLEFSGSPTEKALLSWGVLELNMNFELLKRSSELLHEEAFSSEKKRSGILMKKNGDNTMHMHWKGAAEIIIAMCTHYYDSLGNVKVMEDTERENLNQLVQGMAASSLRCIGFAHKEVYEHELNDGEAQLKENNYTLLGVVGMKDPCRPGVRKAVQDCQRAGVNVKMITGDNVFTAKAIAIECGILRPDQDMDGAVVEGEEFRNYTQVERLKKLDTICLMARSSPSDKLLMVKCLKQKRHMVAVTGDGTNDAPAIKEADIGLSMGIQGTEVAKESSDIIILGDSFASVVAVLKLGRNVYNNIQKFLQFQLTVNVATLVINFVLDISVGETPLTSVQLVWINLIMDLLGALALAAEHPGKEILDMQPVSRKEPIISNIMWRNLIAQALFQSIVFLTLQYYAFLQFGGQTIYNVDESIKDTMLFNIFVLCQIFNLFNARKLENKNIFEGIHKNKMFLGITGITILVQVVMVEFLNNFTGTEKLYLGEWGACIGIAILSWPIGILVKYIPVPHKTIFQISQDEEVGEELDEVEEELDELGEELDALGEVLGGLIN
ncbi:calcium-transporting ATPase 12, plasma membrane-type [Daucus carota subsp. sativus]|uniref:calcium-transporting ATPase 12, plasma membrane-type n=1 Tax=Daucus carota subsp. sativus TaxID=79200 RepID=UPI0007F02FEB|nr:PREDICTED: calcium-transporting ATPase 12, plasma membrane-type-like [Daucus carota subsp. sativus]